MSLQVRTRCLLVPVLMTLGVIASGLSAQSASSTHPVLDSDSERRIGELLARMTVAEKVGQLNQYSNTFDLTGPPPDDGEAGLRYERIREGRVGSMLNVTGAEATRRAQQLAVEGSRLGIPLLFGLDVIHGYRTMFPIPLAETASWDLEAIHASAQVAAREAAAAGIQWTFAPMVDIGRDARWGRVMEGAGEDPYLGSLVAAARVRGFQGDDLADRSTIAATAKHFAGYGFAEAGREYNTVDVGPATLWNTILPPFQAAVEAGVASVMNGFNVLDGVPVTASAYLQRDVLKGDWAFPGFVVSDWQSILELTIHGVAEDHAAAARMALTAGSDMDMESDAYRAHLARLIESGTVDEAHLDDAVRRVLRVKFALGLFDDPYRYSDPEREAALLLSPEHLAVARDVARKSIVLLKNEDDLLPLQPEGGSIAVIGALAADKDAPLGSWRAQAVPNSAVSLLEGIQAAVDPGTTVTYAEGYKLGIGQRSFIQDLALDTEDRSGFAEAIRAAAGADVVVMALGEEAFQSGEARSVTDLTLKGQQEMLLREVLAVNPNVVVVLMNGRPLAIPWVEEQAPAIVEAWHLGSQAGHAIADVLFGAYNPSGKLPVSFPRVTGQVPIYYNHLNTGRPVDPGTVFWSHYTDAPNEPLYPFGYGLSYTTFAYSDVRVDRPETSRDGQVTISVDIRNTGDRSGSDVAQLYIRDVVGSRARPVRELKGFERVELAPGEATTVHFTVRAEDLAFYTAGGTWEAEPGEFVAFVGGDSTASEQASFRIR
jgi:beta-glucosidase